MTPPYDGRGGGIVPLNATCYYYTPRSPSPPQPPVSWREMTEMLALPHMSPPPSSSTTSLSSSPTPPPPSYADIVNMPPPPPPSPSTSSMASSQAAPQRPQQRPTVSSDAESLILATMDTIVDLLRAILEALQRRR